MIADNCADATAEVVRRTAAAGGLAGVTVVERHDPANVGKGFAISFGVAVAAFVMAHDTRRPVYLQQRQVLQQLADALLAGPEHLDTAFGADWAEAEDDRARKRIVVDQVASLTDQSALAWHGRLVRP